MSSGIKLTYNDIKSIKYLENREMLLKSTKHLKQRN